MTETIMPAFAKGNAEAEGKIIGNILAGYGDLELEMCQCLAAVNLDIDLSIRLLFQVRGEERRIQTADQIMRVAYTNAGLGHAYCEVISDMDWCRRLRNQFAHSIWYYTATEGLCLVDLEGLAKQKGPMGALADHRKPLPLSLLFEQERFFQICAEMLLASGGGLPHNNAAPLRSFALFARNGAATKHAPLSTAGT